MTKMLSRSVPLPKTKPRPSPSGIAASAQSLRIMRAAVPSTSSGTGARQSRSTLYAAHLADGLPFLSADRRDREAALLDQLQVLQLWLGLDRSQGHWLFQRHYRLDIDL